MVEETQTMPQELDAVTRAEQAIQRLDAKLLETKALLEKNMEIEARRILGGQSTIVPQTPPKEVTPKEYADKIMRGEK